MNTFALEIWDNESEKVVFYTVRKDGSSSNEADLFFNKMYQKDKESTQELLNLILKVIGNKYGAISDFFNPLG